jgi:LCP family protein required for cell wall assembly
MKPSTRKTLLLAIILMIVGGIPATVLAWGEVRQQLDQPLGPTLSVQYAAPKVAIGGETSATALDGDQMPGAADDLPTASPASAATNLEPMCGGPASMVILAAGLDSRTQDVSGRADVIRAVRVDFVQARVTLLAFPRDLWVTISGLEERGIFEQRINAAYVYGDLYEGEGMGPSVLAQTLYTNFGLEADRYVALSMVSFAEAVDALGGVDFYLEQPVDGRSQGLIYFDAGWHHLDGDQVVKFARIRYPDSDFQRIQRQTQMLMALRDRALEAENWARIPSLVKTFLDHTTTDLSGAEIASLICLVPKVRPEAIESLSVTRPMVTSWTTDSGANVLLPDVDEIRVLVAGFMSGEAVEATSD